MDVAARAVDEGGTRHELSGLAAHGGLSDGQVSHRVRAARSGHPVI